MPVPTNAPRTALLTLPLLGLCPLVAGAQNCAFSDLGSGLTGTNPSIQGQVFSSVSHDFGQGPRLYAGGGFWSAGGLSANNIAAWNGSSWETLGLGVSGTVRALTLFDDGNGTQVYVGGFHSSAGGEFNDSSGLQMRHLARWDGSQWSGLPGGAPTGEVFSLHVHDDGSGPALYASGDFLGIGNQSISRIGRWDGNTWTALGSGLNSRAWALTSFDAGDGPMLWAGGDFNLAGGQPFVRMARWNGTQWLSAFMPSTGGGAVNAFAEHQGTLYAGGSFGSLFGDFSISYVARLAGTSWTGVAGGFDNSVRSLRVFDNGSGPALYAAGTFNKTGPLTNQKDLQRVARWDGQEWQPIADTTGQQPFVGVDHLGSFSAGGANSLILGGFFKTWNGVVVNAIVGWNCGAPTSPPIETLAGCFGNAASLGAPAGPAVLGQSFQLDLTGSGVGDGLAVFYLGLDGTDPAGCGLFLGGVGELLLAVVPAPLRVGIAPLVGTNASLVLAVPNTPALVGAELYFQGLGVGLSLPGFPLELSNGLLARVQP
jgi:trimeric autotransporter adhesin